MNTPIFQCETPNYFIEHVKRPNTYLMAHRHAHEDYEIYYIIDGDRNFFVEDRVYRLTKGNLLIIPPGLLHRSLEGQQLFHERIIVELKINHFSSFFNNDFIVLAKKLLGHYVAIYRLSLTESRQLEQFFHKFTRAYNHDSLELAVNIFFLELLQLIGRLELPVNKETMLHPSLLHKRISDIVSYVNNHYYEDIHMDAIATTHFISPEHLSRSFKKVTGFGFNEYLNNLRLEKSKNLLKNTKRPIAAIAKDVGYQSHTHYGRLFKDKYHMTPSAYRQKVRPKV